MQRRSSHVTTLVPTGQRLDKVIERFWAKVKKTRSCWNWTAGLKGAGYGTFMIEKTGFSAHRVSYELAYGPVPEGMSVLHKCDNKRCVRPCHLFLGTQRENMQDMAKKKRSTIGERHPSCRITEATVREIRASPLGSKKLSALYTLTPRYIRQIRAGGVWKHVE